MKIVRRSFLAGASLIVLLAWGAIAQAETYQVLEQSTAPVNVSVGPDNAYQLFFGTTRVNMNVYQKVQVSGKITDWTGKVNTSSSWRGLWPAIGMLGTNYWVDRTAPTQLTGSVASVPAGVYAYLGDSSFGDTAHQMGLGQNGSFVPYMFSDGTLAPSFQDYGYPGDASAASIANFSGDLYFKLTYDLTDPANKTMSLSLSTDGETYTTPVSRSLGWSNAKNATGDDALPLDDPRLYDDWSDTVFAMMAFNNATSADGATYYQAMGFTLANWEVAGIATVPEPGTMAILAGLGLALVPVAWRKRRAK